jgi:IclR family transcriptional regulator, acetate operon repressor
VRIGADEAQQQRSVSDRLLLILDAVAAHHGDIGLSKLAAATGIAKPTVHRLATELVKYRMLRRGENGYGLGFHLFELGQQVPTSRRLRDTALPLMSDLLEATHEIVQLAVLDDLDVVYVEKLTVRQSMKAPSVVGSRLPAYCSGLGKAILAFSDEDTVNRVLSSPMPALTSATITDPNRFRKELDAIRQRGTAHDRGEGTVGIICVAAPILDYNTRAVAALSITGPRQRLSIARIETAVRSAALTISRLLNTAILHDQLEH